MATPKPLFDVDKAGLAKLLESRGKAFAVLELIQNALDEDVTEVGVSLQPSETRRGQYVLQVADDDPDGFTDLSHAYTLFAESEKKTEAEKRGRFNLGEKLVIAVCDEAHVYTTTGSVHFTSKGRTHTKSVRDRGSLFEGHIRMTKQEYEDALAVVKTVLVPVGVKLTLNGEVVESRSPQKTFEDTLLTVIGDAEGVMRRSNRKTTISIHKVRPGEKPHLYEMGIPVVELECDWHVDVAQKVPLNMDRDNVTPAWRRTIIRMVVDEMHDRLTEDQAASEWVGIALADPNISSEAVDSILTKRFGEKRVIKDPSDPEANKIAMSKGYAVIEGGTFRGKQWDNIRSAGAAKPAGQVTPSPKALNGTSPADFMPRDKWRPAMLATEEYTRALAERLLGCDINVRFINDPHERDFAACWGNRTFTYNVRVLGYKWFERGPSVAMHSLIVHEFGHHYVSDHFDRRFIDKCTDLGAMMVKLALEEPEWFEAQHARFNELAAVA